MSNIVFNSQEIVEFYSRHRKEWNDFYPSEKWVFRRIAGKSGYLGGVLDAGCACGGLGLALSREFKLNSYTGIDIHPGAIAWAIKHRKLAAPTSFICGDILGLKGRKRYDLVVSLSCADWNIEVAKIMKACWEKVKPGGHLVISLRITPGKGIDDMKKSFQYINFSKKDKRPEVANYAVFNLRDILGRMKELSPFAQDIGAYGYWGTPSPTAVTPYKKLIFAVFYLKKGKGNKIRGINTEFNLPLEAFL